MKLLSIAVILEVLVSATLSAQATNVFPSSGNVGIGTANPNSNLQIYGNGNMLGLSSNVTSRLWNVGITQSGNGDFLIDDTTGGIRRLTIEANTGNVGIGTANPQSKLDLGTSASNQSQILNIYTSGNVRTGIGMDATTAGMRLYAPLFAQNHIAFGGISPTSAETWTEHMRIATDTGNVGIGTTAPQYKLAVNGQIGAKEIIVTNSGWADYVFKSGYRLQTLSEVSAYIKHNHHLPDIPSEDEVKNNGVGVGEMQAKLLAKIEELTLHMIEADRTNTEQQQQILLLREENRRIRKSLGDNQ